MKLHKITMRRPLLCHKARGHLNQIRLQCPRRVRDLEVQQHLKDHLFHRVCKHIKNSIRYLHSSPRTTYSQLMIAAQKAESENQEAHDKVRARSATITDSVEGTTELRHQTAKLMAALTRAEQGNSPTSTPNSPRQRGHGGRQRDRRTPGCSSSHNVQTGLGWTASVCSNSVGHSTGTTSSRDQGQNTQGSKERQEGTTNRRDPSSLQYFRCQGWGHMAWECATQAKTLNQSRGNQGNAA